MTTISIFVLLVLTYSFVTINHPLSLSLCLIAYAFFLIFPLSSLFSSWVSMSTMLIFLGGMMVVYLFVISLSSSEKMSVSLKKSQILLSLALTITLAVVGHQFSPSIEHLFCVDVLKLYQPSNFPMIILLTCFLLCALFTVMNLAECFKGALCKTK